MINAEHAKAKKKLYQRWWFRLVVGIPVLLICAILAFGSSVNNKELKVAEGEKLSVSGIDVAILNSTIDGSGEITNFDCSMLSKIAARNGGNFYSDDICRPDSSGFIAKSSDTAQSVVMKFYPNDGGTIVNCKEPVATFTFNQDKTELVSYAFQDESCFQGARLPISKVDVRTPQDLSKYVDDYNYKRN